MQKIILLSLLIITNGSFAEAFQLNHSWLNPKLGYNITSCGTGPLNYTQQSQTSQTCCTKLVCIGSTDPGSTVVNDHCYKAICADDGQQLQTTTTYHATANVPTINNTCFHPTCYFRALDKIKNAPIPVQPLTNNTQTIIRAVSGDSSSQYPGMSDQKVGERTGFNFKYSYPINEYNNAEGWPRQVDYMQNWELSTGTSAMEGLLWSWRMLSNNWQGYWQGQSDYEDGGDPNIQSRALGGSLPSPQNSKNVIIISDGIDSDGPATKPKKQDGTPADGTLGDGTIPYISASSTEDNGALNPSQSLGFRKHDGNDVSPIFETCDANAPIASITDNDYQQVCQKMAAQGVHVNVILYLYSQTDIRNNRLAACASITNGLIITDATPDNIQLKLNNLISQIVTKNIRLIK